MELRHVRYFLAVCEEMSFTKAANKLCIAQPPLSRQIKDLEEELGVNLFTRNSKNIALTEEGELFKQYATRMMDLTNKTFESIKELSEGLTGTLYLASVEGYAPVLFSSWIAGFSKENPNVVYNLWNSNSDDVSNNVLKGLSELAVIVEPYNAEGLNAIKVYEEPWIAMIPQNNPLAAKEGDEVTLDELADYNLIVPSRLSRLDEIESWLTDHTKHLNIRCRIAHMLNAFELTKNGVGIAIYPSSAYIKSDDSVCIKKIRHPKAIASYVLIWDKNRKLSHAAECFLQYVREHNN